MYPVKHISHTCAGYSAVSDTSMCSTRRISVRHTTQTTTVPATTVRTRNSPRKTRRLDDAQGEKSRGCHSQTHLSTQSWSSNSTKQKPFCLPVFLSFIRTTSVISPYTPNASRILSSVVSSFTPPTNSFLTVWCDSGRPESYNPRTATHTYIGNRCRIVHSTDTHCTISKPLRTGKVILSHIRQTTMKKGSSKDTREAE